MNKFIKKIFLFLISIITIQIVLLILCSIFISNLKDSTFLLSENRYSSDSDIYIMGNSHPECAINDSLLPINYINISKSGEPLFYTVIKARTLFEENNKIDTIIIEFNNIAFKSIKSVLANNRLQENYTQHFMKLRKNEHFVLLFHNPLKAVKTFLSLSPLKLYNSKKNIDGKYLYLIRNEIANPNSKKSKKNKLIIEPVYSFDLENLGFFMLQDLIKENSDKFFIITRMPMHNSTAEFKNEIYFQKCVSKLKLFKNSKFIDFGRLPLVDTLFGDLGHLNYNGAKKFTPIFYDSIRAKLN